MRSREDEKDFSMEEVFDEIIGQIPDNVILQLMQDG